MEKTFIVGVLFFYNNNYYYYCCCCCSSCYLYNDDIKIHMILLLRGLKHDLVVNRGLKN